mmetsp:Transcript_113668/g.197512  ORF Transcript_113668/g.197512 Transcript_113668/m.197512 type:complete len:150 (-) Transcript_113668:227-676(-)
MTSAGENLLFMYLCSLCTPFRSLSTSTGIDGGNFHPFCTENIIYKVMIDAQAALLVACMQSVSVGCGGCGFDKEPLVAGRRPWKGQQCQQLLFLVQLSWLQHACSTVLLQVTVWQTFVEVALAPGTAVQVDGVIEICMMYCFNLIIRFR